MFRQLATWYEETPGVNGAEQVFRLHPLQLTRFLEEMWLMRTDQASRPSVSVPLQLYGVEAASGIKDSLAAVADDIYPTSLDGGGGSNVPFRHLMYAYLVENTRAFEIFRRILEECTTGERLDVPSPEGQAWLRTTEALFFSDPHPGGVAAVTSGVRPDVRAVRRNAYFRLFGIDLNHGYDDGRPYGYQKPEAANREFVALFEEFLREVWRGIENFSNTSGANPTDDAAIAELGAALADILLVRRRNGALSREEFAAVSAMSWFHLTLMSDTPIVVDLKANATSPEERLRKLGERVGLPCHRKSEQYFAMADAISNILTAIEARQFANPAGVRALYSSLPPGNPLRAQMMTIVTQWSIATGHDMKAHKLIATERGMPPRALPPVGPPSSPNRRELTAKV
ncbi:MAG: hypothetical protein QOF83_6 [Solirubrobacteraceae bacterium]|jgi:hypothetical protein|nr:hypothetical protein [Solirubrobacteraceae bacterium]